MFRERDPQVSLWQSEFLVPPKKARSLERSWAEVFRNEALPLIDEERFAPMYCADNGRPNRAVQTVLGVHLLKESSHAASGVPVAVAEFGQYEQSGKIVMVHSAVNDALLAPFNVSASAVVNVVTVVRG